MEREANDTPDFSPEQINEMEEKRIAALDDAGINEHEVLSDTNKELNTWNSYFQENITRGKDDLNFCLRDQWTAVERSEFTRLFKPCLTFNKLYDNTKKIVGEQRKNKPDLMVRSLTGKAAQEQIDLRADLVRTIAYQSQNDLVYQTAFRSSLMMSYGAFQIALDYESARSFKKTIKYDLITDATMCAWDATAVKPHKGDGNYCSRRYIYTRDEFFATYPYVTNPVSYVDPYMLLDLQWTTRDTITVCDRFKKEWFPLTIHALSNGMVVTEDEWKEAQETFHYQRKITEGSIVAKIIENGIPKIVNTRLTQDYRIMHYRLIRDQIIDFSEWPSRQLPIVFVDGDSYWIEGRQYTRSFIHEARDAQKLLNYSRSETAAELKNRRREQWIGTPDNIAGYEQDWRNPELQVAMLRARPDPKTGHLPQKMPAWEVSQGLFMTSQAATQDIKEILGFSESDALQGRDISGKARRERKMEGSMSAYVYFDNLNQALEQGGRIVNDLLPYVIGDEERHMIITKADKKTQSIILNKQEKDGSVSNQLDKGEFDVEISTGPSFAVQKEIALEFLAETLQAFPQAFPLIADLWSKNLDVQFMPQISERFKSLVPPEIIAKEEGTEPPPPKADPQQQMMEAEMQEKQAEIQAKMKKLELDEQRLQIEKAELMLKAHKIQSDAQLNVFDHKANIEKSRITHDLDHKKADHDFTHKITGILADLHKHHSPQEKHPK